LAASPWKCKYCYNSGLCLSREIGSPKKGSLGICVFITLHELEQHPVRFQVDLPAGGIEFDGKVGQSTVLHAEGAADLLSHSLGEIHLRGNLQVTVDAPCDRCLEPVSLPIRSPFDLVYMPVGAVVNGGEDEIDAVAAEIGYYEGSGLQLNDVLREVVLLALPMQLVCEENCKGICPVCGQNRNQRECGCQAAAADDRWTKLRDLQAGTGQRN
jgi:uncharacterized protein